jgi:hypothetical protein
MVEIMLGDRYVAFGPDGLESHAGRNGRLHVDEPDGSSHGNHPYLSAVAVLRSGRDHGDWATTWLREHPQKDAGPLDRCIEALQDAPQIDGQNPAPRLDVFEAVSRSAVRLPLRVFAGPGDERWRVLREGVYGQYPAEVISEDS